jgi:hypothetical protein
VRFIIEKDKRKKRKKKTGEAHGQSKINTKSYFSSKVYFVDFSIFRLEKKIESR